MNQTLVIYAALFTTGIVSSLHCIGMCGPILAGFSQTFARVNLSIKGTPITSKRAALAWDFLWYHLGRLWTYALLGLLAGFLGSTVRHTTAMLGWHRVSGIILSVIIIFGALALLGVMPGAFRRKVAAKSQGCAAGGTSRWQWLDALLKARGPAARLLLGVTMGFLPCGLVYMQLAVASALPTPWHAALGMIVFGLGTLPSLSAVLLATHIVPKKWCAQGQRLAAVLILIGGVWMLGRSIWVHDHSRHGEMSESATPAMNHSLHH